MALRRGRVARNSALSTGNNCLHVSRKFTTELVHVSGFVIFGLCPRLCSAIRFIERGEFAQGLDHDRKGTNVAIGLGRLLPEIFQTLFDFTHLLLGGAPKAGYQLAARLGGVTAAMPPRTAARDWRQPSRRIFW